MTLQINCLGEMSTIPRVSTHIFGVSKEIDRKMFIFRLSLGMWPLKLIVLEKWALFWGSEHTGMTQCCKAFYLFFLLISEVFVKDFVRPQYGGCFTKAVTVLMKKDIWWTLYQYICVFWSFSLQIQGMLHKASRGFVKPTYIGVP